VLPRPRTIVSIVPDLLTATKIAATAGQLGMTHLAARAADALEICRGSRADLVIVDLEATGEPRPDAVIRVLKGDAATRSIPVVGFYAHVHKALRESALLAGADRVLPRSAFSRHLVELLSGEAAPSD
jgi:CheY-like chemotaxis protein